MLIIPLNPVPSQTLSVTLAGQACTINVYQKSTGLFLDLYVSDVLIIGGVICRNCDAIVRDDYLGFVGDLYFTDTQGVSDPYYTDLGSRYVLAYMEDV